MRITESTNFNNFWYTRSGDTRHFKDINLATSSVYYCHNTLGNAKVMHKHKHWSSVFLVGSFCVTFWHTDKKYCNSLTNSFSHKCV